MHTSKLDLVDFNAWIVKVSFWVYVWVWHNSFFKHITSSFTFKASSNVTSFSVVVASKTCCNVPISTHKYWKHTSVFPNLAKMITREEILAAIWFQPNQGCKRSILKMTPLHPWEGTLLRSHRNWNSMECPFPICHQLKYLHLVTYHAAFKTKTGCERAWY